MIPLMRARARGVVVHVHELRPCSRRARARRGRDEAFGLAPSISGSSCTDAERRALVEEHERIGSRRCALRAAGCVRLLAHPHEQGEPRSPPVVGEPLVDGAADCGDLRRHRPAAAADDAGAERARLRRELPEVLCFVVRERDAMAAETVSRGRRWGARRARGRRELHLARARSDRRRQALRHGSRRTPQHRGARASARGCPSREDTSGHRLDITVEGHQCDDRQGRGRRAIAATIAASRSSRSGNVSTMKRSAPRPSSTSSLVCVFPPPPFAARLSARSTRR